MTIVGGCRDAAATDALVDVRVVDVVDELCTRSVDCRTRRTSHHPVLMSTRLLLVHTTQRACTHHSDQVKVVFQDSNVTVGSYMGIAGDLCL